MSLVVRTPKIGLLFLAAVVLAARHNERQY